MMYYKEKSNIQVEDDLLYGRPREENVGSSFSGCEYDNTWVGIFYSMFLPHENKLTKKIFGTKKALMREKIRQLAIKRWVIHPCSNFRLYWDICMLFILVLNLIVLPVEISFFNTKTEANWIIFNCVVDVVFFLDLIINFRTGIILQNSNELVILEPKLIAKNYLRTWFFLDLISTVPLDYIFLLINQFEENPNKSLQIVHAGRAFRIFRLAKILSLVRLLRLSRLIRCVSQWQEVYLLNKLSVFFRIFNLICIMMLVCHWSGCLQFFVPMMQNFPPKCWVSLNKLEHADWWEQYSYALFKSMSHMLSIGYGIFPPETLTDMWLTMISMITGAVCFVLLLGHATNLIQLFDSSRSRYREKVKQVDEYMAYRKLPEDMRERITDFFQHRYQGMFFDEEVILDELSEKLREDVISYNCNSFSAFFSNFDSNFISEIITQLKYEIFQPGDLIIKEGTLGTKMYFIQKGSVDILSADGELVTSLSDGSYFGEICLLTKARRVASVRAETYCILYSLSAQHFNTVLSQYPFMRSVMESVANERIKRIGSKSSLSRLAEKEDAISIVVDTSYGEEKSLDASDVKK